MPLKTKKRINLSVPQDLTDVLEKLAERDKVTVTTKALKLLEKAVVIEEDEVLNQIAGSRDKKNVKYLSHDEVWR